MTDAAGTASAVLETAARITVLTGAGISTDSGIPDFRGPGGVWTKNPRAERLSTIEAYLGDPDVRRQAWQGRLRHSAWTARPNPAHLALVALERAGRLRCIATQNIDGLHQAAGNAPDLVLELHGTLHRVVCMACGDRTPMPAALDRVRAGEADPPCRRCGGILKSATISFGQPLEESVLRAAADAVVDADAVLVIGSSLSVHPAAGLVGIAADAAVPVIIVNAEPTPYDPRSVAVIREPIGDAVPRLVDAALSRSGRQPATARRRDPCRGGGVTSK